MRNLIVCSLLLICSVGWAAEPTKPQIVSLNPIGPVVAPNTAPLKVSPGRVQVLKLDGVAGVTWNVIQPLDATGAKLVVVEGLKMSKGEKSLGYMEGDSKAKILTFDSDVYCVMGTGNGTGFIVVQALKVSGADVQIVAEIVLEVVKGDCPKPPVPPTPPPPTPDPPTPVVAQKIFVVIIEESADATAARGAYLGDKSLNDFMKEKGHKWRVADRDVVDPSGNQPADLKRFLSASIGKKLPQLFLVGEKGDVLLQTDLPAKPSELLTLVKKWGGS